MAEQYVKKASLINNFSWALAGNVVYAGCQWGMLMVLAKLGSTEMVGRFALGLAITAPVITFVKFDLRAIQATDIQGIYTFRDYLSLRLINCILALFVIACIGYFGNYIRDAQIVILLIAVAKIIEAICDIFHGLLQRHERMDLIAISYLIKGPLSVISLAAGLLFGGLKWGVLCMMLSWALVFLLYDIKVGLKMLRISEKRDELLKKVKANKIRWIRLAKQTLPMGIGTLLLSLDDNIPRLFVEHQLGEIKLGIFAAMAYIQVAGTTIVRALTYSSAPRLAKAYANPGHEGFLPLLAKITSVGLLIGLIGLIISAIFGEELLMILYTPQYSEWAHVFTWLMAGSMMHYIAMFLSSGIVVTRYLRSSMALELIVLLTIVAGCFCLIPSHGIMGAAWAVGLGTSVHAFGAFGIIAYVLLWKKKKWSQIKGKKMKSGYRMDPCSR
jgi:O-antigen/teichoic acid export membrane protein